jgi:hypothetical protein
MIELLIFVALLVFVVAFVNRPCGCPPEHCHGPHSGLCLDCDKCRGL